MCVSDRFSQFYKQLKNLVSHTVGTPAHPATQTTQTAQTTQKSQTSQTTQHTEPPESEGFAFSLRESLNKTLKTADGLEHPVDAISESVSTSGGSHRVRKVVRVGPKAAHITKLLPMEQAQKSHKAASQRRRLELTKKTVTEVMRTKTNPNKGEE